MKTTFLVLVLLLITLAVNAKAVKATTAVNAVKPAKKAQCVPANCVRKGPTVRLIVQKTCRSVKVGKCLRRTRCCSSVKRCLFKTFCRAQKRKCSWAGKVKKVKNCGRRRRVVRRRRNNRRRNNRRRRVVRRRRHNKRRRNNKRRRVIRKRRVVRRKRLVLRRNQVVCNLYADPHVTGFNKRNFEAQTVGDWILYRGPNLSAHYRGKRFGSWVGPIKFGFRLYHHRIFTTDFTFNSLKIDGKVRPLKNGLLRVGKRGTIRRHNNKITISTNQGEEIDVVSFGWFFNAYVRSRAVKLRGICSQEFLRSKFFNHPQRVEDKKIKLPKCPRRKHYLKQCRRLIRSNHKGRVRACVIDRCAGLKKDIEKKIIKQNEKEKKIKVKVDKKIIKDPRVRRITCDLYADPHVKGFNRKYFEAQTAGDWVLYRGRNLSAHYRGKSFGRWVGPIKFGIRLYTHKIYSVGFSFERLKINGQVRNIPAGVFKLNDGGLIRRNGRTITFSTNDGEEVDFVTFGSFFNGYVRSNIPKITGICSQRFIRSHFFKHEHRGKIIKITKKKCPRKAHFRKQCRKHGLRGQKLRNCVFDRCQGLSKKDEKKIINDNKKEDHVKLIKVVKKTHKVVCDLYADPHVRGFNKRNFEAQTEGDWLLYRGAHLSAHYRGKRFGGWVGPIKIGVRLYHSRIFSVGFTWDKLKIDGVVRNIPNGRTQVGEHGIISRNGNRISFQADGEQVDFITYGWFFNGYVASRIAGARGICSQEFIRSTFFNHPHRGHIVKVTKKPCPRRAHFKAQCQRKGLRGQKLRNCVVDRCNGLDRKTEEKIIRDNKTEEKKQPPRKRVNKGDCQLYADPHAKGFGNKYFEAQTEGDWVLYRGLNLNVHYKGKRHGSWVAPIQWGARVYGQRISSRGFSAGHVNVDGRDLTINGRHNLPRGGFLNVAGNKITISTADGEEADFISGGWFFNAFVRSDVQSTTGICNQQFIRSSFFGHHDAGKVDRFEVPNCPRKAHFHAHCKKQGLRGAHLRNCVLDRCRGFSRRDERRVIRQIKEERRVVLPRPTPRPVVGRIERPRPVNPVVIAPRPRPVHTPRPVVRPAPRPAPRVMVRRRGRGDVWLRTRGGKWVDVNKDGTFNYFRDDSIDLNIDVQFQQLGQGSVISEIILRAKDKLIYANRDGQVTVDGEPVTFASALFQFTEDNFETFDLKQKAGLYEVRGLKKDRFSFEYEKETKSYMIVVGTASNTHSGLYSDPTHAKRYQIPESDSLFTTYVPYKTIAPVRPTRKQRRAARRCCKKFTGVKNKECRQDFYRTNRCLHYLGDKKPTIN